MRPADSTASTMSKVRALERRTAKLETDLRTAKIEVRQAARDLLSVFKMVENLAATVIAGRRTRGGA